jgi:hypothetical protein
MKGRRKKGSGVAEVRATNEHDIGVFEWRAVLLVLRRKGQSAVFALSLPLARE